MLLRCITCPILAPDRLYRLNGRDLGLLASMTGAASRLAVLRRLLVGFFLLLSFTELLPPPPLSGPDALAVESEVRVEVLATDLSRSEHRLRPQ